MKIAIMQPTFLPWVGYFKLISKVDIFIFFDDAQYSKNSWHNRNRILLKNEIKWLTLPIKKKSLNTSINNTTIDYTKAWKNNIISKIDNAYKNHDFFNDLVFLKSFIKNFDNNCLSTLNIEIIKLISRELNILSRFKLSSSFNIDAKRSDKIIELCILNQASKYISPIGAKDYIEEDGNFSKSKIKLSFFDYRPKIYNQINQKEFISHLSIIDLIANIGLKKSKEYLLKNEN
jgi:hypothetical protein